MKRRKQLSNEPIVIAVTVICNSVVISGPEGMMTASRMIDDPPFWKKLSTIELARRIQHALRLAVERECGAERSNAE